MDDENGFSEDNIGKYIYTGDGWHKILSVNDVTIVGCGKNLLPPRLAQTVAGVTYTPQSNGTYIANGTCMGTSTFEILPSCVLPPGKYALSGGNGGISLILAVYDAQGGWLENLATSRNGVAAVVQIEALSGNEAYHRVIFQGTSGAEVNNVVLSPQLEVGDTATAFEPYEDIPFLSIDNAQGQIESVAVEAGCRAKQAGTGEPSPENIRAITGRDSVEIAACGKNLLRIPPALGPATGASAVEVSGDGYTVSVTGSGAWAQSGVVYLDVIPGKTYTASVQSISGGNAAYVAIQDASASSGGGSIASVSANTPNLQTAFTAPSDGIRVVFVANGSGTALESPTTATFNGVMVEAGDTATAFEPYRSMGGGTVTPTEPLYGLPGAEDTVEVSVDGDVTVTRRTGVFIADGDQYAPYASAFAAPEGVYAYTAPLTGSGAAHKENFAGMCSHFTVIPRNAVQSERVAGTVMLGIPNSGDGPQAWFFTAQATAEAFNAWLQQQDSAGTPVTLVYELAAPETEALTAVTPIAPQPGMVNIATDADSLAATVYGSGWETVNDTTDVRDGLGNAENNIDSMLSSIANLQNDVSSVQATLEVMPGEIKSQVLQSDEFQAVSSTVTQTSNGLAVVKEQVEAIDGEVQTLTGVIVVSPPNIDIGSSDSSTKLHLDNEGWDILSEGQAVISARENKVVSPRFHVMDALMIGNLAFRPSGGHLRLLKYGG